MKRILAAATLILPLIGVLPAAAQTNGGDGVAVVAIKSSAQPFVDTLVLRGRTEAERRVDVRSETAGLVNSPPLEKGATVKAGDLLCQLEALLQYLCSLRVTLDEVEVSKVTEHPGLPITITQFTKKY